MNKRASVGSVIAVITIVIFVGVFLNTLRPVFEEFRVDNLNRVDEHDNPNNPLIKMFWYAFNPILWFFYSLMSLFAIIFSVRSGGDNL